MSAYGYNALGMYVKRSRSLPVSGGQSPDGLTTGGGNAWNISCVPDFLGSAGSELMAYREGTASPFAGETRFTSYPYDPVTGVYFAHARLYDADLGRMLSKDPVKRGLNGYPYCGNDPVNHTDPTGEIPTVLLFGAGGGILGGIAGFAGSALDQLSSGDEFSLRRALGSAANGMVTGAVKGP